jgi:hypothetical protein
MRKHYKQSAYEVPCSRTAKLLSLARQLPTDCFDIQAYMFRMICDFMGKQGMVDENRFEKRCTRICEENGPADPALKALSRTWLACSGGILIKRSGGLQWLLHLRSYVRDSDPYKWQEGCSSK